MESDGEPSGGWFLRAGTALVGSRAMLDDGQPLSVMVARQGDRRPRATAAPGRPAQPTSDSTLLPLYLDPKTKLFLVALMWCRPWLTRSRRRTTPLPRTPEIARAALEVTGATTSWSGSTAIRPSATGCPPASPSTSRCCAARSTERGLVRADTRLSDEVVVRVLIEHGIITFADLGRLTIRRGAPGRRTCGGHMGPSTHLSAAHAVLAPMARPGDEAWTWNSGPRPGARRARVTTTSYTPGGIPREELVPLVDRVVEGALQVDHRPDG